jgi:hypothetical protein
MTTKRWAVTAIFAVVLPFAITFVLAIWFPGALTMPVVWIIVGTIVAGLLVGMATIPELVYQWAMRRLETRR